MQVIKAVVAGAVVLSTVPALATGLADLTLHGAAPRGITQIGQPVSVSMTVNSVGPTSAEDVVLRVHGTDLQLTGSSDARCLVTRRGITACRLGTLASGEQWEATFTGIVGSTRARLNASVAAASGDANASDNEVQVEPVVGYLGASPQRVAGRLPFDGGPDGTQRETTIGLDLVNDTPMAMSYQSTFVPVVPGGFRPGAPWATLTPASGSVLDFSSEQLKLEMSADGRTPGLHRAVLRFEHDSLFTLNEVPLSLTVAFWDVSAEHAADPYVHALAGARVASGCSTGNFCPATPLTRATAAVWLLRSKEGAAYLPPPAEGKFVDVPVEAPEAPYIEELARRGVTAGCGGERFCPDQPLSHAELAVFVLRMLEGGSYTPPPARGLFRDVPAAGPMGAWIEEAARRSLVTACTSDGRKVCPRQIASRGDAATMLVKAFNIPTF